MITFWEFLEVAGALRSGEVVRVPEINRLLEQHVAPWTFASFRKMSGKFGINPHYSWGFTPNAMYAYKLEDVIAKRHYFGGEFPFIVVFTIKESARPYIIDLEEADKKAEEHIAPLLQEPYTSITYLDDEARQKFNDAFAKVLPTLPDFFSKLVAMTSSLGRSPVIKKENTISALINRITEKDDYTGTLANNRNVRRSFGNRQLLASLGLHGYLAGRTEAAKIANECLFFYPTDAKVLAEYNTQQDILGVDTVTHEPIKQTRKHESVILSKFAEELNAINLGSLTYSPELKEQLEARLKEVLQKITNFFKKVPKTVSLPGVYDLNYALIRKQSQLSGGVIDMDASILQAIIAIRTDLLSRRGSE